MRRVSVILAWACLLTGMISGGGFFTAATAVASSLAHFVALGGLRPDELDSVPWPANGAMLWSYLAATLAAYWAGCGLSAVVLGRRWRSRLGREPRHDRGAWQSENPYASP